MNAAAPAVLVIGAGIGGIATAAHITHMLRDMVGDLDEGFVNIPREWFARHHPEELHRQSQGVNQAILLDPAFQTWV